MIVELAKITPDQAKELQGAYIDKSRKFNPIQIEDNWYVSMEESKFIDKFEIVKINIQNDDKETD
jgi:hypothetical protein